MSWIAEAYNYIFVKHTGGMDVEKAMHFEGSHILQ